ncbi:MAG: hypothetical protein J5822_08815, partial [Eubacteriaceae bacterium]|nr:hypothetical protein [Eubacteriaceae bacterium]
MAKRMITLTVVLALLLGAFSACSKSEGRSGGTQAGPNVKTVDDVLKEKTEDDTARDAAEEKDAPEPVPDTQVRRIYTADSIDMDLTGLNGDLVYARVNDMMARPEGYVGKVIRVSGYFQIYEDGGVDYYTCM